jgi:hypothetical protein
LEKKYLASCKACQARAGDEGSVPTVLPTYTLLWILVAAFIALGGTMSSMLIFRQNQFYKIQIQEQSEQLRTAVGPDWKQARNSNLIVLMNQLSDQIS